MPLTLIGVDPNSPGGGCPSVWVDEDSGDLLVQGGEELDEANVAQIVARSRMLAGERIVRLPARMRPIIAAALETTA